MSVRVGIDVGGTFTDLVAVDGEGRTHFVKTPSTPEDPSLGVMSGLAALAERMGLDRAALLARTERIVHGTTVATNALLERKGARVGLLTTAGHRDVLEMREGLKGDRYDLRQPPPEPLVPRRRRLGVVERLGPDGAVRVPLDEASLDRAVAALAAEGVTSIAICYLHAYRDPRHERATAERVRAALPEVRLSLSSEVLPQIKEFERVSTTVVDAYVGPAVEGYLTRLAARLTEAGFSGALFIILSHGGVAPVAEAARLAAATVLSGPAGGVAGARRIASALGCPDLVPFDMGGTSTDISLILGGEARLSSERGLGGERIALRSLDIASIGAGGGSIARAGPGGAFTVGPASAGAVPGPACYGLGGTEPTVTDANLLLGYLDPGTFLGGRLDRAAAEAAVGALGERLGIGRDEAASGIHRLINLAMADGIRLMTVRQGVDARRLALLSFGGAAGLHAVEVARELEMRRVLVPAVASVLSAWGMLGTELRYEVARTHIGDAGALDGARLADIFGTLEVAARGRLEAWTAEPVRIERSAEMRYGEQVFEIEVPLDGLDLAAPDALAGVEARFHARHEALYTYASPGQEVVLVNARVAACSVGAAVPLPAGEAKLVAPVTPRGRRLAHLEGRWCEVPVYALEALSPGAALTGPAIVEAETTTVVVGTGDRVAILAGGWLDIHLRPAP